MLFGSALALA